MEKGRILLGFDPFHLWQDVRIPHILEDTNTPAWQIRELLSGQETIEDHFFGGMPNREGTVTDLSQHIQTLSLCDTHEHLKRESSWVDDGPDILQDLFGNYVPADLKTAGATPATMAIPVPRETPAVGARARRAR